MLVLTRKLFEKIYIGDDICITVVAIDDNKIRLGIEAPKSARIYRAEVRDRMEREMTEVDDSPTIPAEDAAILTAWTKQPIQAGEA